MALAKVWRGMERTREQMRSLTSTRQQEGPARPVGTNGRDCCIEQQQEGCLVLCIAEAMILVRRTPVVEPRRAGSWRVKNTVSRPLRPKPSCAPLSSPAPLTACQQAAARQTWCACAPHGLMCERECPAIRRHGHVPRARKRRVSFYFFLALTFPLRFLCVERLAERVGTAVLLGNAPRERQLMDITRPTPSPPHAAQCRIMLSRKGPYCCWVGWLGSHVLVQGRLASQLRGLASRRRGASGGL